MKKHLIAGAVVAAALALLAGCGSDDDSEDAETTEETSADSTEETAAGGASADGALVSTGDTAEGEVLVDADGLSLYGFTDDTDGTPTCVDACADAWPPVLVESAELPEGLDAEVFSVVERPDGDFQLVAGAWPLYRFAGDAAPGDINGQESGGVWFLAAPDGSLIGADGAAPAAEETGASGYDY